MFFCKKCNIKYRLFAKILFFFLRIRYENCKLITIGSLIGGVAGQEAIKLISKQFVPLNNTLIFNGISCEATVLQL